MLIFFADDAQNSKPTRERMTEYVVIGGFSIDANQVPSLENELNKICREFGFPEEAVTGEFKWSPSPKHWMRKNLIDALRTSFQVQVLQAARVHGVKAMVVLESCKHKQAVRDASSHEESAIAMFFERVQNVLEREDEFGMVITDTPSGNKTSADKFLASCIERLRDGTDFLNFERIAINVLFTPSKYIRLLQLADLITSCTSAFLGGEQKFSPRVFEYVRPLFDKDGECVGGAGVKMHPDLVYRNLYHWHLGDQVKFQYEGRAQCSFSEKLPSNDYPYASDPYKW